MNVRCYLHPLGRVRYIPVPKCGSTSVIAHWFDLEGENKEIHEAKPPTHAYRPEGPRTFSILRSPWQRLASTWRNKVYEPHRPDTLLLTKHGCTPGMPFEEFVSLVEERGVYGMDEHVRPQVSFLPPDPWRIALLRLEHLDLDAASYRLPWEALPRDGVKRNASSGLDPYTDDLERRVGELYDEDVAVWSTCASSLYRGGAHAAGS